MTGFYLPAPTGQGNLTGLFLPCPPASPPGSPSRRRYARAAAGHDLPGISLFRQATAARGSAWRPAARRRSASAAESRAPRHRPAWAIPAAGSSGQCLDLYCRCRHRGGVADPRGHARHEPALTINTAYPETPGARSFGLCLISRHTPKSGNSRGLSLLPSHLSQRR